MNETQLDRIEAMLKQVLASQQPEEPEQEKTLVERVIEQIDEHNLDPYQAFKDAGVFAPKSNRGRPAKQHGE